MATTLVDATKILCTFYANMYFIHLDKNVNQVAVHRFGVHRTRQK